MRFFLIAVTFLGLLTGGYARTLECMDPIPADDCCLADGKHQGHSEDQCPEGHHHHHYCSYITPLFPPAEKHDLQFPASVSREGNARPQSERIPEGPFLNSEKPPLI
ncbi:MAG: hypothetical protein QM627_08875 [Luteolibacter sp.]